MKLSLALGALMLPLFVIPVYLTAWVAQAARRYAFARRSYRS